MNFLGLVLWGLILLLLSVTPTLASQGGDRDEQVSAIAEKIQDRQFQRQWDEADVSAEILLLEQVLEQMPISEKDSNEEKRSRELVRALVHYAEN